MHPPRKDTELTPIAWHLYRALDKLKELPTQSVERERFYNNIYHLLVSALYLVDDDEIRAARDPKQDPKVKQSLQGDLDDLFGG